MALDSVCVADQFNDPARGLLSFVAIVAGSSPAVEGRDTMALKMALRPEFKPARMDPCFCNSGKRFGNCCGSPTRDRPPPHGVGIIPGFLDADTCKAWITHFRQQPRHPLGHVEAPDKGVSHLESTHDADRITDIVKAGRLRGDINQQIKRAYQEVIAPVCERQFAWFELPQVLRYEPGGWYRAHADSEACSPNGQSWAKGIDRDTSLLLYLNDDFEGGELSFLNFNYSHRPRTGDLVFFPSDHRYVHQAQPVKDGLRLVVVCWAAFTHEPRVRSEPPPASIMLQ
jgi:hypothetical protein